MILFLSFALTASMTWLLCGQLRRGGFIDHPTSRSSHAKAKPTGGGAGFIIASTIILASPASDYYREGIGILLIPIPLAIVGLLDDRHGVPVRFRLVFQYLTCLALAFYSGLSLPAALAAAVVGTGIVNLINFMDGLDGLLASCSIIWLVAAASLLNLPCLLLIASAVGGFLLFNWHPSDIFMGDTGSTYLGSVIAGGLLMSLGDNHLLAETIPLLLIATPLLGDSATCMARRWMIGIDPSRPSRLHLYQRIHQAGWGHGQISLLYVGASTAMCGVVWICKSAVFINCTALVIASLIILACTSLALDQYVAVPFGKPE